MEYKWSPNPLRFCLHWFTDSFVGPHSGNQNLTRGWPLNRCLTEQTSNVHKTEMAWLQSLQTMEMCVLTSKLMLLEQRYANEYYTDCNSVIIMIVLHFVYCYSLLALYPLRFHLTKKNSIINRLSSFLDQHNLVIIQPRSTKTFV